MRRSILPKFLSLIIITLVLSGCSKQVEDSNQAFVIDTSLCNFKKGPCVNMVNEFKVSLMISPSGTPSETPLSVRVSSEATIDIKSARLEGRDMFMGVIPLELTRTGENVHQGTLIYGSCSSGYMVWRLFIDLEMKGKRQTIMYDFLADTEN